MTTVIVDLYSALGVRPDGVVSAAAIPARSGVAGGFVTSASSDVPMVDGMATLTDVEPGPINVRVQADRSGDTAHWSKNFSVVVPESGTHALEDLVEGQVEWPAPVVKAAQLAQARAEAAADRAEEAADNMEGGVRPGGWLLSDMAQEVLDQFGGGVSIPAGGWPKSDLAATVRASLDKADTAVQGTDPRLTDARTPKTHTHPITDLTTTGATTGQVLAVGAGGVPAWSAASGGAPGVTVNAAVGGVWPAQTVTGFNAVAVGNYVKAAGSSAVAVGGFETEASGQQASAFGPGAKARHQLSSALGFNSATTKADQVMLGTAIQTVTMPGKAELGTGTTQVTLSTRLEGGKVELGVTFPGSAEFIPIATQQ